MDISNLKKYDLFKNEEFITLKKLTNQGFNNTNYTLQTSKQTYLIRNFINNKVINRNYEFKVCHEAYNKGIGAKPHLLDEKNSLMICDFLEGTHKYRLKNQDIIKVALLLKKLHNIKMGTKLSYIKKDYVLCHHDLNPKNFIFSKDVKLIDWEYSGFDDRYFDLATVIIEFNLNQYQQKVFLNSYFKNKFKIDRKKVSIFKKIYINICIKWFNKENNQKEQLRYKKFIIKS